jgi:glutamate carboxypeptidase
MRDHPILSDLRSQQASMLAELTRLVQHESPSREKRALDALAENLAERLRQLGGSVKILDNPSGGDHLLARFPSAASRRPALLLGHFDTVWPLGTLANLPVREESGRLYGPGAFDMKASLVMFMFVLETLERLGLSLPRPLVALLTSDEEIGSPSSRGLIEAAARPAEYVLVLEPPLADGGLKTARKGVGRFTIEVNGKAAHAGVAPENGHSAIIELAYQLLKVNALNDPENGTTVNAGVVQGGTTANVVPAHAMAQLDVRVQTQAAAARLEEALRALPPVTHGTRIRIEGGFSRPPMERTPQIAALFDRARQIALDIGLDLTEGSTGGGSDGNFTAALGLPTLDGLGALGGGAHADDEHVMIDSLPDRAALLAALLLNL